jgi:hypothetical protein
MLVVQSANKPCAPVVTRTTKWHHRRRAARVPHMVNVGRHIRSNET